ncbi:MAG: O-antigen ligase family protein [Methylobacterium mesophilicum]|nr:O-antigen ligase family protein [Methylobacterium mesophilicum]
MTSHALSPRPTTLTRDTVATGIAALILSLLIVSFRPFQPAGAVLENGGGDTVNQLGFGTVGLLALGGLACFVRPRLVLALWGPWFLLLLGFFLLSVLNATDPAQAARAASFTMIGVIAIGAVLVLPPDAERFSRVLAIAGFTVIGLSYAGVLLLPDIAKHTADSMEPQHAGLWRGVFSHKNIAGPVMACFAFAGLYLFRRGWRWTGGILFALAIVFVAQTGSKTTAGLVPLAALIVAVPGLMGVRGLTPWLVGLALAGTALGTLGIVFIGPLSDFMAARFPDMTYTGRTAIWRFGGEMIAQRPWFGYGYESFWGTPRVTEMDRPFDMDWDISGIVHGHNGYLDIAVTMGLPALVAAVFAFILVPLRDYARTPRAVENVRLADFFLMVLLFTTLNAFLESFFFRRADPVWLFTLMGILGLRLVARYPVSSGADAQARLGP